MNPIARMNAFETVCWFATGRRAAYASGATSLRHWYFHRLRRQAA